MDDSEMEQGETKELLKTNVEHQKLEKELGEIELLDCNLVAYKQLPKMENRRRVVVHVTFLKIGEINTLKECFEADVLLRTKWRLPELDKVDGRVLPGDDLDLKQYWNPEVYIDNVLGEPKRTSSIRLEYDANGLAHVVERRRVRGSFLETMELFEFPFDIQDLSVTVMSEKPISEVELDEDTEDVHKIYKQSFIDEQEWYLYKYIESEKKELMKDRADPTILRSALTIRCKSARRPAYFIWNSFSVTFLICCLSFVTFAVKPSLPQNRLQLSFTLVLTAVAFKFVVNQSLPKISYLTYLDRYIFATMMLLVCTCFWHGIQTVIDYHDADLIAIVILAGLFLIYNMQFLLRIFFLHDEQFKHGRRLVYDKRMLLCFIILRVPQYILSPKKLKLEISHLEIKRRASKKLKLHNGRSMNDRYVLSTMICITCVCFYHAGITLCPEDKIAFADRIALAVIVGIYVCYQILFLTRIATQPYKRRRQMKHRELAYINKVKEQAQIRQSTLRKDGNRPPPTVIPMK